MSRRELDPDDYEQGVALACEGCGWGGGARSAERHGHQDFFSLRCPRCDRTLATIAQPLEPLPTAPRPLYPTLRGDVNAPKPDAARPTEHATGHLAFLYDEDAVYVCGSCAWSGRPADCDTEVHLHDEFYEVRCPQCGASIGNFPFATHGEIRDLAAAGNAKAIAELSDLDRQEAFHGRAWDSLLKTPEQLPDLEGEALELTWDFEPRSEGSDNMTIIRHGDHELWREVAYWEGGDRFAEVFTILRWRYGWRLVSLIPSAESLDYLGGDRFTRDCRRAEGGFSNLPHDAPLDLRLGSVIDSAGVRFHVLRDGDLVVWRDATPGPGPPTKADAERLEGLVRHLYRGGEVVSLDDSTQDE